MNLNPNDMSSADLAYYLQQQPSQTLRDDSSSQGSNGKYQENVDHQPKHKFTLDDNKSVNSMDTYDQ